jgi:uncharacterized protein
MIDRLHYDQAALEAFCRRWSVVRLSAFGSVLRDDFGPESDIDLLADFEPGAAVSLWDWGPMLEELRVIFGREVDLIETAGLKNPIRRRHILAHTHQLYAA